MKNAEGKEQDESSRFFSRDTKTRNQIRLNRLKEDPFHEA